MILDYMRPADGLSEGEIKQYAKYYQTQVTVLQQKLKNSRIPVIVLVEGQAMSGRSTLVNELISEVDPRFARVFNINNLGKKSLKRPFIEPFFNAIPENGTILFMNGGWVEKSVKDYVSGKINDEEFGSRMESVKLFERQLKNNGYLVIKLFLTVTESLQKSNYKKLVSKEAYSWMNVKTAEKQVKKYSAYRAAYDKFLEGSVPEDWNILAGNDKAVNRYDAFRIIYENLSAAISSGKKTGRYYHEDFPLIKMPKLADVDLSPSVPRDEYKTKLKELSDRLNALQGVAAKEGITTIIAFEGWDAAGKGSAIRRLAYPIDPRLFTVHPIASPEPHEKARHHLWRFWQRMPETGRIAIFDRTWYGRVMVERLEGFCTSSDWKRAYNEINEFEKELTDWGAVVIKFWLQIDKETQLARFKERQHTPAKRWKITDEDWRNRDKWDLYEGAIDEMIKKTSTEFAPWTIVEANDKLYARLKVIEVVCDRLEAAIKERK